MNFLFCTLPMDIIKYILLFDEHFIIRKGEIISIIPKSDYRYNLLHYVTLQNCVIKRFPNMTRYNYELYNYHERCGSDNDLIQVTILETNNIVEYVVWIGRQKLNSMMTTHKQHYVITNPDTYHWEYVEYEYIRQ